MSELVRQLSKYAAYHRDGRNVATHMAGIPAIVLAIEALTSRATIGVGGLVLTPAMLISAAAGFYYLKLDLRFGAAMAGLLALGVGFGAAVAGLSAALWLTVSLALFVGGWALQFVGHHYEGRKPAFLDDLKSLLIGPLFVVAEAAVALGLRKDVGQAISPRARAD
jgi:uncharacterized membrane protein YGL010W